MRSLTVQQRHRKWTGSYIGANYALLMNSPSTVGPSARDCGWRGMRAIRNGPRLSLYRRTS